MSLLNSFHSKISKEGILLSSCSCSSSLQFFLLLFSINGNQSLATTHFHQCPNCGVFSDNDEQEEQKHVFLLLQPIITFSHTVTHLLLHHHFTCLLSNSLTPDMFSSFPINSQEDHNDLILTQNQPQLFPNFDPSDHNNFNDLLLAMQLLPNDNNIGSVPQPPLQQSNHEIEATTDLVGPSNGGRKRTMRRDRHSKIVTAKGPRDRRMRLSLDVAKKFFDLQDLLGFDKASKTVEWLLNKSRHAIRSLTSCGRSIIRRNHSNGSNHKMESSISDCGEEEEEEEEEEVVAVEGEVVGSQAKTGTRRSSAGRTQAKVLTKPKILKESRVRARARARERTMEKRMSMLGNTRFDQDLDHLHGLNQQPNKIRSASSSSFVDCGEPSSSTTSIPMMMRMMMMMGGDEHGGITSTFDYNCNNNNNNNFLNQIQGDNPLNLYQEGWNNFYQSSLTAATAEEQQQQQQPHVINHNIHQRGWDVLFNNQSSF